MNITPLKYPISIKPQCVSFIVFVLSIGFCCLAVANKIDLYFEKNSSEIVNSYYKELDDLGRQLVKHPELRLRLTGFSGSESNMPLAQQRKLSMMRAIAVREYLTSTFGIASHRIELAGRGFSDSTVDRQRGPRVELVIQGDLPLVEETATGRSPQNSAPSPNPPPQPMASPTQAAREALGFKQGDADVQKTLKEILTSRGATYNLIEKNKFELDYTMRYSHFGTDRVEVEFSAVPDGGGGTVDAVTLFDVVSETQNSFRHRFRLAYGLRDDINLQLSLPLVMKSDPIRDLEEAGMGDLFLSFNWQPYAKHPRYPSAIFFSDFQIATGTSPFEVELDEELATGDGLDVFTFGVSLSKIMDPVALYTSFSWSLRLDESGLEQVNEVGSETLTLTEVNPGGVLGLVIGAGYALSYEVNIAFQMGLNYGQESDFVFSGTDAVTGPFVRTSTLQETMSAVFSTVVGFRLTPKTLVTVDVGLGLTSNSPDFNLGVNIPIDTEGWGK